MNEQCGCDPLRDRWPNRPDRANWALGLSVLAIGYTLVNSLHNLVRDCTNERIMKFVLLWPRPTLKECFIEGFIWMPDAIERLFK